MTENFAVYAGKDLLMQSLVGHVKEIWFNCQSNGKSLNNFNWRVM